MRKLKLLFLLCVSTVGGALSVSAQTNYVAGWDGGSNTGSPSNFGWTSSANRTLQPRNNNGGIRMTTTYSGYKLEDNSSYSYSATSDPSSVIFWVRYNSSGESFTYTFQGLEPNHYYEFSGLVGWHNNSSNPTFTVKLNDGTIDLATMTKYVSAKQKLYSVSANFTTPNTITNTTDIKLIFTCNQTGDCMEAISALKLVDDCAAYEADLKDYLAYANQVNVKLNNSDLTTAINTAQGIVNDGIDNATYNDVDGLKSAINTAISAYHLDSEGDDVAALFVWNNGFELCEAYTSNKAASTSANSEDYSDSYWKLNSSAAWSSSAVVAYGGEGKVNGVSAPSSDNAGNEGKTLGISVGWDGTVTYKSKTNSLPAGSYRLKVNAYNASTTATQMSSKFGFVCSGTSYLSSKNSFASSTWEVDKVDFTLTEETEGYIQIGGTAVSGGSDSNAKVFFDNISLIYYSPLKLAQIHWQEVHDVLAALDATALPDAAEEAITTELAKSVPTTTVEAVNEAKDALQALIDSYDGIKAAYDEYKALKALVADLKNTTKYTFTGAEALSTFNSTLSDIDVAAEAATDAATLTALLPDLKAAGNAFVGAIDSNDGFDLTYNVVNNSFETGALSPWTTDGSNDTGVRANSNGTYTTTGVDGDYLFNTWDNGAGSKVSQTLSSLPNGYYTVTALVASDAGNTINILAGATTKTIDADGTGKTQFVEGTTDKTLVSEGSLEIGTNSATWYKSDYFRLTYYTVKAGAAEAWAAAKAAAEAARDNIAYVNVTGAEKTALLAEIAKEEPTTAEAYGTATTALQEATSAFIAAKGSYDALIAMRTTGETYTTVLWPRASAAKKTALDDAIAAEPTNAADAVTKTNAIVTAYRQFVESNGLAEGVDVAVNKTSELLVTDASVSTSGWTSGTIGTNTNEGYTDGAGNVAGRYFDGGWSASAGVDITLTQNLTLPAGQYQLQITARGSDKLTSYTMSIGGESVDLPTESSTGGTFGRGWSDKYVTFESDGSELTLTIAATSTEYYQWISFNRLRLMKLDATLATAEDYENLNNAIAAAEAHTLGFETGQYAPYNNVERLTEIATAKAINQEINNTQEDIQAMTTTLNNATWTANATDVDAIYNGMFNSDVEGDWGLTGWTRTNAWGQQRTGIEGTYATAYYNQPGSLQYGNQSVYTMPLAANTIYKLTFAYRSHENNSNKGMTVSVLKGEEGLTATAFPANGSTSEWKLVTQRFKTGSAGNYILTLANSGNTWMTNVSLVKDEEAAEITISEDATTKPQADPLANVTLIRTLKASYWNTFSVPFDAAIPSGWIVKEYDSEKSSGNEFYFKNAGSIVAGKPYLVRPTSETEDIVNPSFDNVIVKSIEGKAIGNGDYKFAAQIYDKDLNDVEGTVAYLSTSGKIKKLSSEGRIKGLRAYFILPTTGPGEARISFGNDDTTGISSIDNGKLTKDDTIYDLQGRKVTATKKGIYVVNGKKVIK